MAVAYVDNKYRITIEKAIRKKVKVEPGDKVMVEPIDESTIKVSIYNKDASLSVEEDPAWKALHNFVTAKKKIPPKALDKIIEEEVWEID